MASRVRFGLFQFDPATGELSRDGMPIRLQHQPARVLTLLVERPGEIVSRDDLRRHVWGSETFVDFERGLNFCIAQIRAALGDSADSPRYVETIPKRGYRFIAPVAALDSPPLFRETATDAGYHRVRIDAAGLFRPRVLAGLVIVMVLAAAIAFVRQQVAAPGVPIPIAVAAFDNQTGAAAFDVVAEGLADATVVRLAQSNRPPLAVVGNARMLRTARRFRDVKRIGADLKVDYVVLGQVQREGAVLRVLAHLIRVSDERHVWANRFDRPALTLAAQGEIADAIARQVSRRLQATHPERPLAGAVRIALCGGAVLFICAFLRWHPRAPQSPRRNPSRTAGGVPMSAGGAIVRTWLLPPRTGVPICRGPERPAPHPLSGAA